MKQFVTILLCSYLVSIWCLQEKPDARKIGSRIIGGEPARAAQFPFAAAITVQTNSSKFFCGGTLINREWILTAGQCVDGAILFTIQMGSNNLEGDDRTVTLSTSEYVIHPYYNSLTVEHDIALIKLRIPVQYSMYLISVDYVGTHFVGPNINLKAIGWGQTADQDSELSNELMWTNVVALSNEECRLYYGNQIGTSTICVEGNYNEGSCYGDTGSAILQDMGKMYVEVVGIASFLSGNGCESTDPSGYIRTYPYRDWIKSVAGLYV
ncbi:brachyurin-like [Tenebrio molitor]|uniref:brachyurin-like n=1 Tax=Tenebrio molitor TaxID=7067 RepID=UPI0036247945